MATIILAGGLSTRMSADKATLIIEGRTLVQHLIERFSEELGSVIVVQRSDKRLSVEGATVVPDIFEGCGPLAGLHAGLTASPDDRNFAIACDMPFADPEVARFVLDRLDGYDAAVPMIGDRSEPLHAAYRKSCLFQMQANLEAGRLKVRETLDRVNTRCIPECEIREIDPELSSFTNINTPEEYSDAVRRVRETLHSEGI